MIQKRMYPLTWVLVLWDFHFTAIQNPSKCVSLYKMYEMLWDDER